MADTSPNAHPLEQPETDLPDDDAADADIAAGRVVSHAKVARWLNSWGSPAELPFPEPEPN